MIEVFAETGRLLAIPDPADKCAAVAELSAEPMLEFDHAPGPVHPVQSPGRPDRPELVDPAALARRRLGSPSGRAALVHAIAHIEFNAINLALDAAHRFRDMPQEFTRDWISVAADEARHFQMLEARLASLGHRYGDFPAHNGLWEMAVKTAGNCLARMALVPRVLEARGLDVTPGMIGRLRKAGDDETVSVLEIILEEEVRHVAIGSTWFRYCCQRQELEPLPTFIALLDQYFGRPKGPFNIDARLLAGFTREELAALEGPLA